MDVTNLRALPHCIIELVSQGSDSVRVWWVCKQEVKERQTKNKGDRRGIGGASRSRGCSSSNVHV